MRHMLLVVFVFSIAFRWDELKTEINAGLPASEIKEESRSAAPSEGAFQMVGYTSDFIAAPLSPYSFSHSYESEVRPLLEISEEMLALYSKDKVNDGDCAKYFYLSQSLHNEGIDLLHKAAAGLTTIDDSYSAQKKCDVSKETMKVLDEAEKKFDKGWKATKKGITACIHTPNIDAVVEAGNGCWDSLELIKKWRIVLKQEMARSCK